MKLQNVLTACLLLAAPLGLLAATPEPSPTPPPTPTQAVKAAPEPTLILADGKPHTAAEVTQILKEAGDRIAELTQQRNAYLGEVVDLQNQLQKLQQPKK